MDSNYGDGGGGVHAPHVQGMDVSRASSDTDDHISDN